jgi:cytochrome b561
MTRRYHPVLVALHWLLAVALLVALGMGALHLEEIPNGSADKLDALRGHMIAGGLILALTLVRLVMHFATAKPPRTNAGAAIGHYALYGVVILMGASGIGIALAAGLPGIVFLGSGAPLPETFAAFPARAAHGFLAKVLLALIAVHIVAALYHHFVRHDGLLRRMSFKS